MTQDELESLTLGIRLTHDHYDLVEVAYGPNKSWDTHGEMQSHNGPMRGVWLRVQTPKGLKRLTGREAFAFKPKDDELFLETNPNRLVKVSLP